MLLRLFLQKHFSPQRYLTIRGYIVLYTMYCSLVYSYHTSITPNQRAGDHHYAPSKGMFTRLFFHADIFSMSKIHIFLFSF